MHPFFAELYFNPSATYLPARQVRQKLDEARQRVARQLGAKPSEIFFTAGGTEANNLAIAGVMKRYPDGTMLTSAIEHDSVLRPAAQYNAQQVPVTPKGVVDVEKLATAITESTVLVSIMYANNEVGTLQPIRDIAALLQTVRASRRKEGNELPIYLHTDAAQAANYLDLHIARLGVDLLTLNGGKIYGPKQSGVLYVRAGVVLEPLLRGGGQERGLRSGTENIAACVGLATALDEAVIMRPAEARRLQLLRAEFIRKLQASLPGLTVLGHAKLHLPNIVSIMIPGCDNERVLLELEQRNILAAAGSACSASNDEPSHVLKAMGFSDEDARSSLRFSMGRSTTEADISRTVSALVELFRH